MANLFLCLFSVFLFATGLQAENFWDINKREEAEILKRLREVHEEDQRALRHRIASLPPSVLTQPKTWEAFPGLGGLRLVSDGVMEFQ